MELGHRLRARLAKRHTGLMLGRLRTQESQVLSPLGRGGSRVRWLRNLLRGTGLDWSHSDVGESPGCPSATRGRRARTRVVTSINSSGAPGSPRTPVSPETSSAGFLRSRHWRTGLRAHSCVKRGPTVKDGPTVKASVPEQRVECRSWVSENFYLRKLTL